VPVLDLGSGRRRRLVEELAESGLTLAGDTPVDGIVVDEIDLGLRPPVHERRVPSSGTVVAPSTDPSTWGKGTQLDITVKSVGDQPLPAARRFADGLSSWLVRHVDGRNDWLIFDRPAGSERDLVVLAQVVGGTVVQRHPTGMVRVAGSFGVLRWEGFGWHHEPPVSSWIDALTACSVHGEPALLDALLQFAVHDLGSMGIGSLLVYRPDGAPHPPVTSVEQRLPVPPPLRITKPAHLAPLRHALAQIDGAAVFDGDGILRQLGVRLIPSRDAEATVEAFGGTRHTSARRYSHDDPLATVVAVSEDGPVSAFRDGELIGRSRPAD
jgi:sensor domain DACNK-containing protein/DisA checkpoint controller-like protein